MAITSIGLILLQSVLPVLWPWSLARATYAQEASDEWQPVAEGYSYKYRDTAVTVTFTKVTQPGWLKIKEVAVGDTTGYDITSDMPDGTFTYDLTLPNPQPDQEVKVQYSEDGQTYQDLPAEKQNDLLIIKNLDHFTIFVVRTDTPDDTGNNSTPDATGGSVCVSGTGETYICYQTIQAAVDAASSGDEIHIGNGTYAESVTVDVENLTLVGESTSGVIISAGASSTGISVSANNVTINTSFDQTGTASDTYEIERVEWSGPGEIVFGDSSALTTSVSATTEGTYTITLTAWDYQGNSKADDFTLIWDTTNPIDPTPSSTSHTLSTWENDRTVDVTWSDASDALSLVDGFYTEWNTLADALLDTPTKEYEETDSTETSPSLSTGQDHYFHIATLDNAGNWTATAHLGPFWIDAKNPTVSWVTPSDGAYLRGTVSLEVNASDVGSGVRNVRFRYKPTGGTFSTIFNDTDDPYAGSWDTTTVADGEYTLRAHARDYSDRTRNADINVTIDNTSPTDPGTPTADVTSPTNQEIVTWTWTAAEDSTSGIQRYLWNLWRNLGLADSGTTTDTQLSVDVYDNYGEGDFMLDVQAEDNAGNTGGIISSSTTSVDVTSPTVTSAETQDTDGNGNIDAIELTFSENIDDSRLDTSGGDGWEVDGYEGEVIGSGTDSENDNILILAFSESGSSDTATTPAVSYTSSEDEETSTHDLAGNELASDTWATTDGAAPATPTATPAAGDYLSDQTVTLSSSDGTSDIASIYYTTDGITEPSDTNGTLYGDPIAIGVDTTLKAIAYDNAGNASEVLTAVYGIAPVISEEASSSVGSSSVTVTWTTDDPATSRVIYDTVSHPDPLGAAPNYGYANSTVEADTAPKVTDHSVVVSGLSAGTTYYYRTVSHGSPEAVSDEQSFATSGGGGGDGGGSRSQYGNLVLD